MTDFTSNLRRFSEEFNRSLPQFFIANQGPEYRVAEAMYYSLSNGGKRLRPFLLTETAALFGIDTFAAFPAAVALEMLHTYSLIHDDLPAMDNDDLRRGKPTCHKQYDEATAILAGDGLLTYAFELTASPCTSQDPAIRAELTVLLAKAAGAFNGMVAGQMLDLHTEKFSAGDQAETIISRIEEMKTGRLIRYACEAGAVLGKASPKERQALINYSRKIGMAFQITDDMLDVSGSQELMGKTLNKDAAQNKLTFVSLYGLQSAGLMATDLIKEAKDYLKIFGPRAENLTQLADFILTRRN